MRSNQKQSLSEFVKLPTRLRKKLTLRTSVTLSLRRIINVNVTLDSSLDTDKLEKQLKLLRRTSALRRRRKSHSNAIL